MVDVIFSVVHTDISRTLLGYFQCVSVVSHLTTAVSMEARRWLNEPKL